MDELVISRAGIIGAAPHRFLDVLIHPNVKEFRFFYFDNEEENFKTLYNLYEKHKNELHGKLVGRKFSWPSFYNRYITSIKSLDELVSLIPSAMLRTITAELTKSDILIIGDNDFDSSFGLASICYALGIPYVLTFKETRMRQNDVLERLAIEGSKRIVVPHEGYVDFIRKKHGIDITKKVIFADVDWRGKFVYEKYLKGKSVEKLSSKDGKPHVCILSMRTVWDWRESRSPGRYYYLDVIRDLLKSGFTVHLRTKHIIKSLDQPIVSDDNPYNKLLDSYPDNFFIEPPIDLNNPSNYEELSKYDYGLLTSGIVEDETFLEFEKLNVPNRYYEYKISGVTPIAPKGLLKYMERNFSDVLFFSEPEDILQPLKTENLNARIGSYGSLIDSVIQSYFSINTDFCGDITLNNQFLKKALNFVIKPSVKLYKIGLFAVNFSGSNPFALYKYATSNERFRNDFNNLEVSFINRPYVMNDDSFLYDFDFLVFDTGAIRKIRKKQIVFQTWHGFPLKALGILTQNMLYQSRYGEPYVENIVNYTDYVLSYSRTYETFLNACFPFNSSKYILTGMPRNDFLFQSKEYSRKKLEELLSENLDYDYIVLYAPTVRKYGDFNEGSPSTFLNTIKKLFLQNELLEQLKEMRVLLLIKPHPIDESTLNDYLKIIKNSSNAFVKNVTFITNEILKGKGIDLYEILPAIDVLVSDYSSITFDWLLTNKPVIHYIFDLEEYYNSRGMLVSSIEDWLPGEVVNNFEQLIPSILKTLHSNFKPSDKYLRIKRSVHHFNDNKSSERFFDFLKELLR